MCMCVCDDQYMDGLLIVYYITAYDWITFCVFYLHIIWLQVYLCIHQNLNRDTVSTAKLKPEDDKPEAIMKASVVIR